MVAIENCCFTVIGSYPYFELFCNNSIFGTLEQYPMTDILNIIPCVIRKNEHLVIKASRERNRSLISDILISLSGVRLAIITLLCFLKLRY